MMEHWTLMLHTFSVEAGIFQKDGINAMDADAELCISLICKQEALLFAQGMISATRANSMLRNDGQYKHIFIVS